MAVRQRQLVRSLEMTLVLFVLACGGAWAQEGAGAGAAADAAVVEEPTEAQIRDAYAAALEDINARSVAQLGDADASKLSVELEDLTKLGCRGLGRPGVHYDCRVERRVRRGEGAAVTDVVQLWLAYEDDHWVAR
jgi:hypothetical protein